MGGGKSAERVNAQARAVPTPVSRAISAAATTSGSLGSGEVTATRYPLHSLSLSVAELVINSFTNLVRAVCATGRWVLAAGDRLGPAEPAGAV
jgi:hypothetical protein